MTVTRNRRVFLPVFGGMVVLSWFLLWAWSRSPYSRYLEHGTWLDPGPVAFLCNAVPGGQVLVPALIHTVGWLLMIFAMMLPTTLPLVDSFQRMTSQRDNGSQLVALVVFGYVSVWTVFGLVAHGLDSLVLESVSRTPWLAFHGWVLGALVMAGAGLFQFSALKYHCLEKCRTPLGFIMEHWSGRAQRWQAFLLGVNHGAFCVGCCWALMLLMFVVGTGSIGWMLALGAIMAMEKNLPWGRQLSAPLGVFLLEAACVTVMINGTPISE